MRRLLASLGNDTKHHHFITLFLGSLVIGIVLRRTKENGSLCEKEKRYGEKIGLSSHPVYVVIHAVDIDNENLGKLVLQTVHYLHNFGPRWTRIRYSNGNPAITVFSFFLRGHWWNKQLVMKRFATRVSVKALLPDRNPRKYDM